LEDADPLDAQLSSLASGKPRVRGGRRSRMRLALGLSPTPRPGLVLLPLGLALGPHGLGVLSVPVLTSLDPVVSVALAALGAFVGMDLDLRRLREWFLVCVASLEAGTTLLVVAAGVLIVHTLFPVSAATPWLVAVMLGICAAPSSTVGVAPTRNVSPARRIGDLDDVLPIVLGVIAFAAVREGSPLEVARLSAQATLLALTIAVAGWLLVSRTASDTEHRVFAIGTLLLIGGAAAHLELSALFAGFVAGSFWNAAGSVARERIERDLRYLHHPLIALLLLVAGARMDLSLELVGPAAVYLICRLAGKLAGGWLASLTSARAAPRDLGLHLISPGVVGIAFALNVVQVLGATEGTAFLTIVIAGSLASDLVSLAAPQPERPA
jgi:uncharacterized membrane protein